MPEMGLGQGMVKLGFWSFPEHSNEKVTSWSRSGEPRGGRGGFSGGRSSAPSAGACARDGQGEATSKQVEVETDDIVQLQDFSQSEQVQSADTSVTETPQIEIQSIATSRARRQIKPPQRYGYENMVAYAISVAQDTEEEDEPFTYNQTISNMVAYAISVAQDTEEEDQMFHDGTKHIDIKFHFVRDVIGKHTVTVKKIGTEDNRADMFTKSLTIAKFKHCLDLVAVGST
uniref:Uncharacterized protein n=1 Tax=Ananas comosus var. bracteatus TaxID=296719 RepID=A0A6V7PXW3_ANACO|nr:unnamed protein product [Ananas comosus var. bracteatus]